jgi:nucleoside-diphosphate-sugar epimerase
MAPRVLITGATGLLGRHVVATWPEELGELVAVGRPEHDLLVPGMPRRVVEDAHPDVVVHLAWSAGGLPGYRASDDNHRWVETTIQLATWCHRFGAKLLAVGTVVDESPGEDEYTRSKAALRRRLGQQIESGALCWLRPFYVFDPASRRPALVAEALSAIAEHRPIRLSFPEASHDFVHAEDVAGAIQTCLQHDLRGVVDVGSGRTRLVTELVERLGARWAGSTRPSRPVQHDGRVADIDILTNVGWAPTTTEAFFKHG